MGLGGDAEAGSEAAATPATTAAAPVPKAAAAPVAVVEAPPPPDAPYVAAAKKRKKVPFWIVPVLLALPFWGFMYVGTLEPAAQETLLSLGAEQYSTCANCHGASGGGGSGRALNEGEVTKTFPSLEEHVWWVVNGSPAGGTPYGDPNREGGVRLSQSFNGSPMAGFGGSLSAEEILAVVAHERVEHGEDSESVDLESDLAVLEAWAESAELPASFEDGITVDELVEETAAIRAEVDG